MALAVAVLPALALTACFSDLLITVPSAGNTDTAEATATSPHATASSSRASASSPRASTSSPTSPPAESITPSEDLDAITVSDADVPEITVPAPWAISSTQTKVLRDSSNPQVVGENSRVIVNYVGVNGRTGAVFDSSFQRGKEVSFSLEKVVTGFKNGLAGQKVGSRVLIGMTGADGYAQGNPQAGIQAGDSLLFVVDIIASSYDEALGEAVTPAEGLPTMTMTDGKPELTFPEAGVNADQLVVQPLIKGSGAEIAADSTISVKFRVWGAKSGKLILDGWSGAQTGKLSTLINGWKTGLLGQTAGSRVMLVVPSADSYPNGEPSKGLEAGEGVVYVIDILDVKAAS